MTSIELKHQAQIAKWTELIKECRSSGLLHKSQRFCHLHGLFLPACRTFSASLLEHLATSRIFA